MTRFLKLIRFYQDGPYHALVEFPTRARPFFLWVENDGEEWLGRGLPLGIKTVFEDFERGKMRDSILATTNAARLAPGFRMPLLWARKAIHQEGQTTKIKAPSFAADVSIPVRGPISGATGIYNVSYSGWGPLRKTSWYTLEQIHAMIETAIERCQMTWGWAPQGIQVQFHDSRRAAGLAFLPGTGPTTGVRKVSVEAGLVQNYSADAILGTILHEFCHHYREERWPRKKTSKGKPHDGVFCRVLRQVDPTVTNEKNCTYLTKTPDAAILAERVKRKQARGIQPEWSSKAGDLHITVSPNGDLFIEWKPRPGHKWSRWRKMVSEDSLLEILKAFDPRDWSRVRIGREGFFAIHDIPEDIDSLLTLLQRWIEIDPEQREMREVKRYIDLYVTKAKRNPRSRRDRRQRTRSLSSKAAIW